MVTDLLNIMLFSSLVLGGIFLILLVALIFKPDGHRERSHGRVSEDLVKIRDQINGN